MYSACNYLLNGINFFSNSIRFCNTIYTGPFIIDENNINSFTYNNIITNRKNTIEQIKNGNIPEICLKCPFLENKDWDNETKINIINVFHWIHCNCGCIYCSNKVYTKGFFSDEIKGGNYSLYPIIKQLYNDDLIDKTNLSVHFGGGEPAMLDEIDDLVDIFLKNNVKELRMMSSCIQYSKAIEKVVKSGHMLVFSLSAGSKEVFAKIKRRDYFEQTINNIKRYQKAAGEYKNRTESRYIIFEKYNNNKEEIKKWLDLNTELEVEIVNISLDFCGSLENKKGQKIEEKIYELIDFAKQYAKENKLQLSIEQYSKMMLEKGYY